MEDSSGDSNKLARKFQEPKQSARALASDFRDLPLLSGFRWPWLGMLARTFRRLQIALGCVSKERASAKKKGMTSSRIQIGSPQLPDFHNSGWIERSAADFQADTNGGVAWQWPVSSCCSV